MSSLMGIGNVGSAGNIDELIQAASTNPQQPASGGSTARRIFGTLLGGVANVFLPGAGGVISNLIGGAGGGGLGGSGSSMNPAAMLQMQQQMAMEQEAFTTASTVLKDRHDSAMTAIQNSKSN